MYKCSLRTILWDALYYPNCVHLTCYVLNIYLHNMHSETVTDTYTLTASTLPTRNNHHPFTVIHTRQWCLCWSVRVTVRVKLHTERCTRY